MIRLAICGGDIPCLERVSQEVEACNRQGRGEELFQTHVYHSPQALADNVEDGDLYDVFLLDVESPGAQCLSLAWKLREKQGRAVLLFLTSRANLVLTAQGAKLRVLRYVSKLELEASLPEALSAAAGEVESQRPFYLFTSHYHDVSRVAYQDILYVHRSRRATEIVPRGSRPLRDSRSLGELFQALEDPRFLFIQRGCFVNLDQVSQVTGGELTLKTGQRLPVSKSQLPKLRATLVELWGGKLPAPEDP